MIQSRVTLHYHVFTVHPIIALPVQDFVVGCLVNLQKVKLQELVDLYDYAVE